MKTLFASLGLAALCAGCGSPATSIQGTYQGTPVSATEAISANAQMNGYSVAEVIISNVSSSCERAKSNQTPKNSRSVELGLFNSGVVGAGKYPIAANTSGTPSFPSAAATFVMFDDKCAPTVDQAVSGSITVDHASDSGFTGSFDLTFGKGDHLTGSFSSSTCAISQGTSSTPPACS
jgi:hypothetical protein